MQCAQLGATPGAAGPKAAVPGADEPEAAEPGATEAEAAAPRAAEPKAAEQDLVVIFVSFQIVQLLSALDAQS